jgi:DNA-binding NarL/FixJ family response regulator
MRHINSTFPRPTIVLADDHADLLPLLWQLLTPGYNVLEAVHDGLTAVDAVLRLKPDIAVLDIAMPRLDGFGVAREMRRCSCQTRIVFLTLSDDNDYISAAFQFGALGYVLKPLIHSDLIPAIENALAGHVFVSAHSLKRAH